MFFFPGKMQTNEETGTIDITQKQLFQAFNSIEGRGKKPTERDYYGTINKQLPPECKLAPGEITEMNNEIRTYKRRKKNTRCSMQDLIDSSSDEVVVSINVPEDSFATTVTTAQVLPEPGDNISVPHDEKPVDAEPPAVTTQVVLPADDPPAEPVVQSSDNERPLIAEPAAAESPPVHPDEQPPEKKSRRSFTATFTKSWKDFNDLKDRQKKNITKPLVEMLENFISTNEFTLTVTELLDYLKCRVKEKKADVPSVSFSPMEAVSFMHCMALSKEHMRQMRYFLKQKGIEFPTTNKLLPIRQSLRPPTCSILDGKGRGLDIKELVVQTVTSIIQVVKEDIPNQPLDHLTFHLKDGGDGAGTMPALKSRKKAVVEDENTDTEDASGTEDDESDEEDEAEHIFQYGIIPLKLVRNFDGNEEILWENKVPNSARSLRPLYLIREKETNTELLDFVIKETDLVRNDMNTHGLSIVCDNEETHQISCDMRDTMKDLKFKRWISGLGGADCILCKSKVADWTNLKKIEEGGFKIDRNFADTQSIFNGVLDEDGNIRIRPKDFETRSGVTQKPITDSDQHSITITHSYINGTTWFLKMLYRCNIDYKVWEKKAGYSEHLDKSKAKVQEVIKKKTGLCLDYVNSAGGKGGTSTDGKQGRRFYSDELTPVIRDLLSVRCNVKHKQHMLTLHKQLSIILRVVSCTRKINLVKYEEHCKETMINIARNFPWSKLNHTLHGTIQHSAELIRMNGGESLGWYSEEGLEANNKDIRNYLEHLSRKCNSNTQIEDVHHRLLERSNPYLIHITSKYTGAKLCRICNASDHTVRTHDVLQFTVHGLEEFFL